MHVAHYFHGRDEGWVLSIDNRFGHIYLHGVTHWRDLPESPAIVLKQE